MQNSGNLTPPAGGKNVRSSTPGVPINTQKYSSNGVPTTNEMGYEGLSVSGDKPFQLRVRDIKDGVGPRPDPRKGTVLPESDDALAQIATIEKASLSQGVFEHQQNVEIPWEGFDDPANRKI